MDCEKCIFAQYGNPVDVFNGLSNLRFDANNRSLSEPLLNDRQVGCECDRLDTFEERGEAYQTLGSPYYQLTKFCNMYRTEDWVDDDKRGREVSAAREEVMPLFGIAVWDHQDATFDDLDKTVMSMANMVYPTKKMKMMVSTFQSRGVGAVADLINRVQAMEFINTVATFHLHEHRALRDTEIFKKLVQGTFFVHIEAGYVLPPDLFEVIDNSMNDQLERFVMWEGEGWSAIHKKVATSLYLQFNDYDKLVDHVRDIAQQQNVYRKV